MRLQQHLHLLGATLLAAFGVTIAFVVPLCVQIEEPVNIVAIQQFLNLTMTTFMVATAHAVLFGLPLFLLVRRKRSHVGIAICALGGFVVAALPFGVLALVSMLSVQNASTDGRPTIVNGVPTLFSGLSTFAPWDWQACWALLGASLFGLLCDCPDPAADRGVSSLLPPF